MDILTFILGVLIILVVLFLGTGIIAVQLENKKRGKKNG